MFTPVLGLDLAGVSQKIHTNNDSNKTSLFSVSHESPSSFAHKTDRCLLLGTGRCPAAP